MLRAHSFVKVVLFYNNWSSFFLMVDLICLQFPLRRILMTTSQTDLHFFWSGFVPVMTCGWQRIRHGVVFQSTKKQKWPLGPSFQSTILESVFALWQSDSEYVFIFLLLMLNFEKNHPSSRSIHSSHAGFGSKIIGELWNLFCQHFGCTNEEERRLKEKLIPYLFSILLSELLHFKNCYIQF